MDCACLVFMVGEGGRRLFTAGPGNEEGKGENESTRIGRSDVEGDAVEVSLTGEADSTLRSRDKLGESTAARIGCMFWAALGGRGKNA